VNGHIEAHQGEGSLAQRELFFLPPPCASPIHNHLVKGFRFLPYFELTLLGLICGA
jgi:hypothetical protein